MNTRAIFPIAATLLALLTFTRDASATVTSFTSRAAFNAASGPTRTIDFATADAGGPLSATPFAQTFPWLGLSGVCFKEVQTYYDLFIYSNAAYPSTVRVFLPPGTFAMGTNVMPFYAILGTYTVTLSTGDVFQFPEDFHNFPNDFFGVVSDMPIAWATFELDNTFLLLDNFSLTASADLMATCPPSPPDGDGDGVLDVGDNCVLVANADQVDTDADSQGDACDVDDDGDGVLDVSDNCVLVANADQADTDADSQGDACDDDDDGDGSIDSSDNCPLVANADQADTDADGQGDACDGDDDGDGVLDIDDNCPQTVNPDQLDTDADEIGDDCDPDLDADGMDNTVDNCPTIVNADQMDLDGDQIGDVCDADDDNDGVGDTSDNCAAVPNTGQTDFDVDGLGDACDTDVDGDAVANANDSCAATPLGAVVDAATGCSIDQLCPCDGPRGQSIPWRNHGQYVSCVARSAGAFFDQHLIAAAQKDAITSSAAQSNCGGTR